MEQQGSDTVVSVAGIAGLRYTGKPQLMKTTAVIYAPKGVRLNTVVPGLMKTPYTTCLICGGWSSGKIHHMEMRHAQVPMRKTGDAWDVTHATLFLVSGEAQYITGQELIVDGGITSATGRT
ncbi:uncharacterized protein N7479_005134 [Penicillium vulpinum]|uniref:uncharacterized protein n=1 Tax=Penicillium vulpinum TaxID=29845 RepID=UPI0025475702|nr:uncharacterized protein N7479_005134 [Penicillium vulpinum]KAJ5957984.1 hypothetical protein N7479_005134 [Penicillium vulpinum]